MKKTFQMICLAAVVLAACSKQTNLLLDPPVLLGVNVGISMEPATKAIITGTAFSNGHQIGVQVLTEAGAIYETGALTNVMFSFDGADWSTLTPFYLTNTTGKVHAYYPYVDRTGLGGGETNAELFTTIPVSVPASLTTGNETDYMYATPITGAGDVVSNATGRNTAALTMNHAMTQISFLVYKENYPGTGSFTAFSIEDVGATDHIIVNEDPNDLAMNITTGAITGGQTGVIARTLAAARTLEVATADPLYPSNVAATLRTQVATKGTTTLLVPTGEIGAGEVKFSFTIDGKTSSVNNSSVITWLPGKQYIYKVKFSGTALEITSVTITDWDPQVGDDVEID
jgi:hypothetical protein